jgi:hypothetical protein
MAQAAEGCPVLAKKFVSGLALAVLALGVASLVAPTPAHARPPIRCTIEIGDAGCAPCYVWNGHLCRCVKIASCKL